MSQDLTPYLQRISAGEILSEGDTERAFNIVISGQASPEQIAGLLMGLASRGESITEITGAARAMRERVVPLDAPEHAIDCCGTGGDHSGSFNISTAVSFVVAGCDVPVAKHGNRASSSKSGAADVLEALGVNLDADMKQVYNALWRHNICFLMAPRHHPAAKHVAPVRKELGARTIFNLLGPLLNPANTKRQLVGVYAKKWVEPMAEVLHRLGVEFAWVVHGADGLDELSTTGISTVAEMNKGKISLFEVHPHDIDIGVYKTADLKGGDAQENARMLRALLEGERGAYRDIVLLNSAAALIVAGKAENLQEGAALAAEALDQGKALEALENLIKITNEDAA